MIITYWQHFHNLKSSNVFQSGTNHHKSHTWQSYIYNTKLNFDTQANCTSHKTIKIHECQVGKATILKLLVDSIRQPIRMLNNIMVTLSKNVCNDLWYFKWITGRFAPYENQSACVWQCLLMVWITWNYKCWCVLKVWFESLFVDLHRCKWWKSVILEPRIRQIKTSPSCPDCQIRQLNTPPSFADLQYIKSQMWPFSLSSFRVMEISWHNNDLKWKQYSRIIRKS